MHVSCIVWAYGSHLSGNLPSKGHNKGYLRFTCFDFDSHFKDFSFMKAVFDSVPTKLLAVLKYRKRLNSKGQDIMSI